MNETTPPDTVAVDIDLGNGSNLRLTMTQEDKEPSRHRHCGSCSLCCRLVPVSTLGKAANQKCRYSRQNQKGCCSVHGSSIQPEACKTWCCWWLVDPALQTSRPDRAHYVIDIMPDWIIATDATGAKDRRPVLQIWCDPAYPEAHRDPKLRAWIAESAKTSGMAAVVRFRNGVNNDALLLAPPCLNSDGQWYERWISIGNAAGMWNTR